SRRLPIVPPASSNARPPAHAAAAPALASRKRERTAPPRKRPPAIAPAAAIRAPAQGPSTIRAAICTAAANRKRSHWIGSRERSRSDSSNSSTRMTAARKRAKAVCATWETLASEIPSTPRPSAIVAREEREGRIRPLSAGSGSPLRLGVVPLPAIHVGFWPAISLRQSAGDPETRRHYWQGH